MKYLKYFKQTSEYEVFKESEDYVLPNVSFVVETNSVGFWPKPEEPFTMVDLGLPSGTLWADRNIGAASPEDVGLYFQWGDTVGYTAEQAIKDKIAVGWTNYFDSSDGSYNFNKYASDKLKVLQPEDNAATVNMGSKYRMPTKADFNELNNNKYTKRTFITLQGNEVSWLGPDDEEGIKGIKYTSKTNNNSIFIPTSGVVDGSLITEEQIAGYLWSSELTSNTRASAYGFNCYSEIYVGEQTRNVVIPVRGVCSK